MPICLSIISPQALEYNLKRRRKIFVFNYTSYYDMQSYCIYRTGLKLLFLTPASYLHTKAHNQNPSTWEVEARGSQI